MLTENAIASITYVKDSGVSTDRVIIPTYVPNATQLVRALDVTDLAQADQLQMQRLAEEYKAYKENIMKTMFSFEDWVDHTYHTQVDPKWRSFKQANITEN